MLSLSIPAARQQKANAAAAALESSTNAASGECAAVGPIRNTSAFRKVALNRY